MEHRGVLLPRLDGSSDEGARDERIEPPAINLLIAADVSSCMSSGNKSGLSSGGGQLPVRWVNWLTARSTVVSLGFAATWIAGAPIIMIIVFGPFFRGACFFAAHWPVLLLLRARALLGAGATLDTTFLALRLVRGFEHTKTSLASSR